MGNTFTSRTSSLIQPNNHKLLGNHFMPQGKEDSRTQKNMGVFFRLPNDTFANICDYFTFPEILLLCTVSKGMLVVVSQDRIWKFVYEKKVHWFSGNTPQENVCLKREGMCCWKGRTLIKYNSGEQQLRRVRKVMVDLCNYNEHKKDASFFSGEIARSRKEFEREMTRFAITRFIALTIIFFFTLFPLADFMFRGWVRWLLLEDWIGFVYTLIYMGVSIYVYITIKRLATKFYLNDRDGFMRIHGLTRQEVFNRDRAYLVHYARALENLSYSEMSLKKYKLDAILKRYPRYSPMYLRIKRMLPT